MSCLAVQCCSWMTWHIQLYKMCHWWNLLRQNKARCDNRPFWVRAWCGQHLSLCKPRLTAEQHYDEEAIICSGCYTFSLKSPSMYSFSQGKGKKWTHVLAADNLNEKCSNTSLGVLPEAAALISGYRCGSSMNHIYHIKCGFVRKIMRIQEETQWYTPPKNTHISLNCWENTFKYTIKCALLLWCLEWELHQ